MSTTAVFTPLGLAFDTPVQDHILIRGRLWMSFSRESREFIFEQLESILPEQFPATLEKLLILLENIVKSVPSSMFQIVLLRDTTSYLCVLGYGKMWLIRDKKAVLILGGPGKVSGPLENGDVLLVADKQAGRIITTQKINLLLEKYDWETVKTMLKKKLKMRPNPSSSFTLDISTHKNVLPQSTALKKLTLSLKLKTYFTKLHQLFEKVKPRPQVLVLLITSVILVPVVLTAIGRWQIERQGLASVTQILEQFDYRIDEAAALIELNPIRARKLLTDINQELVEFSQTKKDPNETKIIDEKQKKLTQVLEIAQRHYEVSLASFFDLSLLKFQAQGNMLALYQDALVVLDRKNGTLFDILLTAKSARIIYAHPDIATARSISISGEDVYILFTDRVSKLRLAQGDLVPVVERDESWVDPGNLTAYGGNLYILDGGNQIWKYTGEDALKRIREAYFLYDTKVDLTSASQLRIDGSVWIVAGGHVRRFTQGQEVEWQPTGMENELGQDLQIYTDDLCKNLYVLDKRNNRVVVFDKDGLYLSLYSWKEQLEIYDFVVSERLKKILLLSSGTIYGIDLK